MRQSPSGRFLSLVATGLTLWAVSGTAIAQTDDPETPEAALRDFIHYVLINRPDAAELMAKQILDGGMPATAFADLVDSRIEDNRFQRAIAEAMRRDIGGSLEGAAADLQGLYETGRRERARSPQEIARNIELLTGNLQGKYLARERLLTAGEYSVPQLFEALMDTSDTELAAAAHQILRDMGSASVMPLCQALVNESGYRQQLIAEVLGEKGYTTAIPFLAEVERGTNISEVREACSRAISNLGGAGAGSVADLYLALGEVYYAERPEVTSFPGEEHQLLWSYSPEAPSVTLVATPIRTEVYHEAMAMRMGERAMGLAGDGVASASLWVASNIKREIEQAPDYDNPAYGADRRSPGYYAIAAGMAVNQNVLARALETRNTPLARAAIAAIAEIAGGSQLWSGNDAGRPLVEALGYANRRVQFDAALAFGLADPQDAFAGADRVVPLLASAVRDATDRYAIVLTDEVSAYQGVRSILEGEGYQVLPRASDAAELEDAIAETAGIDVLVTVLPADAAVAAAQNARYSSKLAVTPVLIMVDAESTARLTPDYARDPMVMVRRTGLPADLIANAINALVEDASGGPIGEVEAREYGDNAIAVLRDLAISGNEVLNVDDATRSLITSLSGASGPRRLAIGEVLSLIDDERAQRAIAESAFGASGPDQAALLGYTADSAKRFGNLLEDRHVGRVFDIARGPDGEQSIAAAALLGALGVSDQDFFSEMLGG